MSTPKPRHGTTCKTKGCTKETLNRGHCGAHYQAALQDGTLPRIRQAAGTRPCQATEPCDRPAVAKNLCTKHYNRLRNLGTTAKLPTKPRTLTPVIIPIQDLPTCTGCHRTLRPYKSRIEDYPGTVFRAGATHCGSCAHSITNGNGPITKPKFMTGTPCLGCDHPLRPKGTKLVNHPGTKAHQAGGYCSPCYKLTADGAAAKGTAHITNKLTPIETLTGNDLINRQNLDKYFGRRHTKHVPPEGLPLQTWTHQNRVTT